MGRFVDTSRPLATVASPLLTGIRRGTAILGTVMVVCPLSTGSIAVLRVATADGGANIGVGADYQRSSNCEPGFGLGPMGMIVCFGAEYHDLPTVRPELALVQWD